MAEELLASIEEAIRTATENLGASRENALHSLWALAEKDENREMLCRTSFQLLSSLETILETDFSEEVRAKTTGILWYLSRNDNCKMIICSPQSRLPSIILNLFSLFNFPDGRFFLHCTNILNNLFLNHNTHPVLLSPNFQIFSIFKQKLIQQQQRNYTVQYIRILSNFLKTAESDEELIGLIKENIPKWVTERLLQYELDPTRWPSRHGGLGYWCLSFLADLSYFPSGRNAIRAMDISQFLIALMAFDSLEGIRSFIILTNLCFDDFEATTSLPWIPLTKYSRFGKGLDLVPWNFFARILNLIHFTLHYRKEDFIIKSIKNLHIEYSALRLRLLTFTLFVTSTMEEFTAFFVSTWKGIVRQCNKILIDFIDDKREYYAFLHITFGRAGGGGKDFESISYVLQTLINITARPYFVSQLEDIDSSLFQRILNLQEERSIPQQIYSLANILWERIREKKK